MGKYFSNSFLKFMKDYERGRITDDHLDAFRRDPDRVMAEKGWDARMIGMIPPESYVYNDMSLVDGKPLYIAKQQTENGKAFVVYGKYQGPMYDRIDDPIVRDGKLLYVAKSGELDSLMCVEERSEMRLYVADDISWHIFADDGVPTFFAFEATEWYIYRILPDRPKERKKTPYDDVSDLAYENGKALYVGRRGKEDYVVWGDTEIGGPYTIDSVEGLQFVNHLPFFIARTGARRIFFDRQEQMVLHDDEQVYFCHPGYLFVYRNAAGKKQVIRCGMHGAPYDEIEEAQWFNGLPLYIALRNEKRLLVHGAAETECPAHVGLRDLVMVDGQLVYVTESSRNPEKRCVVFKGKEGKPYDDIFSLHVDGSKIVYGAMKGRSIYRVSKDLGA